MSIGSSPMRSLAACAALAGQLLLGSAIAQEQPDARGSGVDVVSAFGKYCFNQPFTVNEIAAKFATDSTLTKIPFPADFSLKEMGEAEAWALPIGSKAFQLIVIHRLGFNKSGIQCFLRTSEEKGTIFPYIDAFKDKMREAGLKGREIDIPSYFRASGKVTDGRSVEARLMTRSAWPTTNFDRYTLMAALYE